MPRFTVHRNPNPETKAVHPYLLAPLVDHGVLGSDSPKGAVSMRFPAKALDVLFSRLFPEA